MAHDDLASGAHDASDGSREDDRPLPVIVGGGVTGLAISRALSQAGIAHRLVCEAPGDTPRLGESLNPEGSLEAMRQFPDLTRCFVDKRQVALFYGPQTLSFDAPRIARQPAWNVPLGYPGDVRLLHVDRIAFDLALYDSVIADPHCQCVGERVTGLDARPRTDRIEAVLLASGRRLASSYVFDASNHLRLCASALGLAVQTIGEPRRVVFAHYRRAVTNALATPPWMQATSLLRLESGRDAVDAIAWCIPLADYVSVGVGHDPATRSPNAALLLDWTEKAYAARGIGVRAAFDQRSAPVDLRYQHYVHERCYGRNWLLAGSTCCQVWFPSAAGVGSGLFAARLAPDLLRSPLEAGSIYQDYMAQVATSHARLEWLASADATTMPLADASRRATAMIRGNVKRLVRYAGLTPGPAELRFGNALPRLFELDRVRANRLRAVRAERSAQAAHAFGGIDASDPWRGAPLALSLPTDDVEQGPAAILAVAAQLAGRADPAALDQAFAQDFEWQVDDFAPQPRAAWDAWVGLLRASPRLPALDLRVLLLAQQEDGTWQLDARWTSPAADGLALSRPVVLDFALAEGCIARLALRRVDFAFVFGEELVVRLRFADLLADATTTAKSSAHTAPA